MSSTDSTTPVQNGVHNTNTSEAKRKVSILTDPPSLDKTAGYDNLGFDGGRRKISQVSNKNKSL